MAVSATTAAGASSAGRFFGSLGLNGFAFAPSNDYGDAGAQVKFAYFNGAVGSWR